MNHDKLLDFPIRISATQDCQDGEEQDMAQLVALPLFTTMIFHLKQETL
jgi:hypothetical protein